MFGARPAEIAAEASGSLSCLHGNQFSAWELNKGPILAGFIAGFSALALLFAAGGLVWLLVATLLSLFLAAAIVVRLFAAAASCDATSAVSAPVLRDHELPVVTVIVALYREAQVAPALAASLQRLDYPVSKLDIIMVVEADDHETRRALEALGLPAYFRIVIAPEGQPRTKPRALNIGLALARGSLTCVFDAEDIPEPRQLREAAARFAVLPSAIACLQGRLAIDNFGDGWLARCFALEYAALFDVVNPSLASLGAPIPLGGTSNHFRTDILRKVGGWDAWNVTEDLDLGLRLARFGYSAGVLEASTFEEAPVSLRGWMNQRRRWFKGWFQTLFVHAREPRAFIAGMGWSRALVTVLHVGGALWRGRCWGRCLSCSW